MPSDQDDTDAIEKSWRRDYPLLAKAAERDSEPVPFVPVLDALDARETYAAGYRAALAYQAERHAAELQAARAELLKHQHLVEALTWLPAGTVVDFCDLDGFLLEIRARGWKPQSECDHKFIDSNECLKCGWGPPEETDG